MYAIVKTGGKQYRVEQGQSLLVERLSASEGDSVTLDPLLYVDGSNVVDQVDGLSSVTVEARVVGHERGPKLRVVKFKPKRGYKRRTGHRQDLTRIEVVGIKLAGGRGRSRGAAKAAEGTESPAPVAAEPRGAAAESKPAAKAAPAKAEAAAKAEPAAEAAAPEKPEAAAPDKPEAAAPEKPKTPRTRTPKGEAEQTDKPDAAAPERPKTPRTRAKKTSEEASDGT